MTVPVKRTYEPLIYRPYWSPFIALEIDVCREFEILGRLRPRIFFFTVSLLRQESQLRGCLYQVRVVLRTVTTGISRGDVFRTSLLAVLGGVSAKIITKAALVGPRSNGNGASLQFVLADLDIHLVGDACDIETTLICL